MEQTTFLGWTFDDIVFLGRNKDYGAYQLRQETKKNSGIGVAGAAIVSIVVIVLYMTDFSFLKSKPKEEVIETTVTLAEPPPLNDAPTPPPPPPPPPPQRPTVKFLEMIAKKDEEVQKEEEPVKVEEIKNQEISDESRKGDADAPPVVAEPVIASGPVVDNKVFTVVEQMPEFPGGDEALFKFIQKNIQYPDMERENDIQGRVVVGFTVNTDGTLTDIAVKKGVSSGIDKEAVRVVKLLPNFKPGKQQGKAVRVSYILPIMFKLASQ